MIPAYDHIDPHRLQPANGSHATRQAGRGSRSSEMPTTAGRPLGKDAGKDRLPSPTPASLLFVPFAGGFVMGDAGQVANLEAGLDQLLELLMEPEGRQARRRAVEAMQHAT